MTSDDIISMHKACSGVIEELSMLDTPAQGVPSMVDARLESLRQSVMALAVVQRDLLKSILED